MATIGWIGLGVMGREMALHLAKAGHELAVYNRTRMKAADWVARNGTGRVAETPADAARGATFVFTCVGNDDDVRSVVTGDRGALSAMASGGCLIDHTTASAELARELYGLAKEKGVGCLDAPVSGGQSGAKSGALTVMAGGDAAPFAAAAPMIGCYAKKVNRIGGPGAGQLTKMVNQICIAGLVQSLAEGIHFAGRAGLDLAAVMETIAQGAAQSWQMENRWRTMSEDCFDFGFAVDWMRKDLGMCLAEAARNGASLPVARLVDGYYGEVQAMGGGRWDTSSLLARLERLRDPETETR